ncbi:MAG: PTS transporter subunit EIIC [Erysipelotrichaceae bacterium]|nr:PTS transporter subunit EIIC [Erysipelotrichaceae bacterium]
MLKRTTILLICAAGASSSLVVNRMKENLEPNENWVIEARSINELPNVVAKYDVILVAPQVNYTIDRVRELAEPYGTIKVLSIDPSDYAAANGQAINQMIRDLFSGNVKTERRIEKMSETKKTFMDKLQAFMEDHIVPIGMKIANQRHLAAIRDGLAILIPVTIVGGFAVLLAVPPIPATITEATNPFYAFLLAWKSFAGANAALLMAPYYLTIGIIAVYVVVGVSYQLAKSYNMNALNNAVAALLVYLCVSGAFDVATASLNVGMLGAGYMFSAMMVACLVVEINRFFQEKNIVIKMPDTVPPNVAAPFNVLLPLVFNVIVFLLIDKLLIKVTGAGIARLVYTIFQPLMRATGSLPSVLVINFLMTTFWFFGIHGANMLSVVTSPITTAALAANAEAVVNGQTPPYIYAGAMNSVFGNWITYTAMLVIIFIFGKSNQTRSVAKVAIVPSCFNINEPSIFGLPTVLNVYTYIPMIICSFVNCSTYYLLASANAVGRFYVTLPFTVPGPLQAFLATGDGKTIILWFALFVVDLFILYPFITTYDKQLLKQETEGAE